MSMRNGLPVEADWASANSRDAPALAASPDEASRPAIRCRRRRSIICLLRCAERSKQIDHALSSGSCRRHGERCLPPRIADVEIGSLAGEQLHHLTVALQRGNVHGSVADGIGGVDVAAKL